MKRKLSKSAFDENLPAESPETPFDFQLIEDDSPPPPAEEATPEPSSELTGGGDAEDPEFTAFY